MYTRRYNGFSLFLQDVTHKIVDAIGAIAGSSLEQTTWLRRNLEVKPSPKIMVDGTNLESDVEGIHPPYTQVCICRHLSFGGSAVKNLPAVQETKVQSLGQDDPLEDEMATHSSILAWRIPRTEKPGWLQFMGSRETDTT